MGIIGQEPVAFGALLVVIVTAVAAFLKLDPAVVAGIDAAITAFVGFFVRGSVTPVASPVPPTPPQVLTPPKV